MKSWKILLNYGLTNINLYLNMKLQKCESLFEEKLSLTYEIMEKQQPVTEKVWKLQKYKNSLS